MNSPSTRNSHSIIGSTLKRSGWAAISVCLCLPAFPADQPEVLSGWTRLIDVANPYATVAYTFDSNVFRLADDAPPEGERSDQYATLSVGFLSDIPISQQRFELSAVANRNIYQSHDELDYTSGKGAAIWHWSTGGLVSGTVGYRHNRSLRSFANQIALPRIKDIRSENRFLGSVDLDLPRNWRLGVHGDLADISFSTDALDLQRESGSTALEYVSRAGNVIGFGAEFVKGDYDRSTTLDFDEYTVGPTLDWQLTAKTRITGRIGYTNRDVADPARLDHDDITGRVVMRVGDIEHHRLDATAWREVSNLGDEIAEFALVQGISFEPFWQLSSQVGLHLQASYEDRDFKGIGADAQRQDDVFTGGVFADWAMNRNLTVTVGVDAQRRSSTRDLQDYDFSEVQLKVTGTL